MKEQGDFLNHKMGYIPLIKGKDNSGFRLDADTQRRKVPDAKKTL